MGMSNGMTGGMNGQFNQKINPQAIQAVFQHLVGSGMFGGATGTQPGSGPISGPFAGGPNAPAMAAPSAWNPQTAAVGINNAAQSAGFLPSPMAQQPPMLTGRGNPVQVHPNIAPFPGAPPAPGWNPSMLGPGTTASANPSQLAQPNALYQSLGVGPQPGQTIADRQALWDQNRAASGLYKGN